MIHEELEERGQRTHNTAAERLPGLPLQEPIHELHGDKGAKEEQEDEGDTALRLHKRIQDSRQDRPARDKGGKVDISRTRQGRPTSIPSEAQQLTSRVQIMVYKKMVDDMQERRIRRSTTSRCLQDGQDAAHGGIHKAARCARCEKPIQNINSIAEELLRSSVE